MVPVRRRRHHDPFEVFKDALERLPVFGGLFGQRRNDIARSYLRHNAERVWVVEVRLNPSADSFKRFANRARSLHSWGVGPPAEKARV